MKTDEKVEIEVETDAVDQDPTVVTENDAHDLAAGHVPDGAHAPGPAHHVQSAVVLAPEAVAPSIAGSLRVERARDEAKKKKPIIGTTIWRCAKMTTMRAR